MTVPTRSPKCAEALLRRRPRSAAAAARPETATRTPAPSPAASGVHQCAADADAAARTAAPPCAPPQQIPSCIHAFESMFAVSLLMLASHWYVTTTHVPGAPSQTPSKNSKADSLLSDESAWVIS